MTHDLAALEHAWNEGRHAALDIPAHMTPSNPYTARRKDRIQHVRNALRDNLGATGSGINDTTLDTILDAHADWMAAHQTGDSAAEVLLRYVTTALVHTVEYVGPDTLPALPGWSWFDALSKVMPDHPLLTRHRPDVRRTQGWASYPVTPHGSTSNEDTKPETPPVEPCAQPMPPDVIEYLHAPKGLCCSRIAGHSGDHRAEDNSRIYQWVQQ